MFEQDYIMRLIREIIRTLLKLIFNIDLNRSDRLDLDEEEYDVEKYEKLLDLIDDGQVNEAENKLMDDLSRTRISDFKLALMFYSYLNEKEDEFLEQCNYNRKEIAAGIQYVARSYGYDELAVSLINLFLGGI